MPPWHMPRLVSSYFLFFCPALFAQAGHPSADSLILTRFPTDFTSYAASILCCCDDLLNCFHVLLREVFSYSDVISKPAEFFFDLVCVHALSGWNLSVDSFQLTACESDVLGPAITTFNPTACAAPLIKNTRTGFENLLFQLIIHHPT